MMGHHKEVPVLSWYTSLKHIEAWEVLCDIFLGYVIINPADFELEVLIYKASIVWFRLCAQEHIKTEFPTAILCLIYMDLNGSFHQAVERRWRVLC